MTSSQAATIAIAPEYWRRQGVPDSDASVSFAYLQKAVAGFSSAASRSPSAEVNHGYLRPARVVEDAEGFDCRSSERPRKKRAQSTPQVELPAKKAEDAKQEKQQEQPPPPLQQATEPEREASAQNVKPEAQLIEQATRKPTPPETSGIFLGFSSWLYVRWPCLRLMVVQTTSYAIAGEKRRQSRATSEKKQATQSTPVQVQATPLIAASKAARQASKPVQIAEPTPKVTHIYSPPNLPPGALTHSCYTVYTKLARHCILWKWKGCQRSL